MKRNIIEYITLSALIISSVTLYFVIKQTPAQKAVITGEYDGLWVSDSQKMPEVSETRLTEALFTQLQTDTEGYVFLNINTATMEELMLLDGVGEVIAKRIIAYRNASGGFNNIEEIMQVSGIGEKTFSGIRNHIYVQNPVYPTEPSVPVTEAHIPTQEQTEPILNPTEVLPTEAPTIAPGTKFNLNTVTADELMLIPNVDRELAESIINLRTSIHGFSNVLEILYAEGMEEHMYSGIAEYLYVENTG